MGAGTSDKAAVSGQVWRDRLLGQVRAQLYFKHFRAQRSSSTFGCWFYTRNSAGR